jgi:hypothetical protein
VAWPHLAISLFKDHNSLWSKLLILYYSDTLLENKKWSETQMDLWCYELTVGMIPTA